MKTNNYPVRKGQLVTLAIKHWFHDLGQQGTVKTIRRDKRCVSGLRIWVDFGKRIENLDSRWFREVPETFTIHGK